MIKKRKEELFSEFNIPQDSLAIRRELQEQLKHLRGKIIVLDDDPTGVQTVHDIPVYTDWSLESIQSGFQDSSSLFFILTNSRSFTEVETIKAHKEIANNILIAAKALSVSFILISRGDSTLRGHYPLETKVLRDTLEAASNIKIDGEILIPFFKEGGRYTAHDIHYVEQGEYLVPSGETEFAKDATFGYHNSHLPSFIEEKTYGAFKADQVTCIPLENIRSGDIQRITETLMGIRDFNKVVVNALEYFDLEVFTLALLRAMELGKTFMFRSAASFIKVIGGICDRDYLSRQELRSNSGNGGGLIIIGSHVQRTTEQFEVLKLCDFVHWIEFDQHLVVNPSALDLEVQRVVILTEACLSRGYTVAIYTKRKRLELPSAIPEEELQMAVHISDALSSIVKKLSIRPDYIIAKGGITSSDIGIKGLGVKKAIVQGQVRPGIPVWRTGEESKFPGMPYIIFPGNVGNKETLLEVVELLRG